MIKILLFAGAVSFDGFIAGMACGVRLIRIPLLSQIIIVLASGFAILVSMFFGKGVGTIIEASTAHVVGAVLLILIAAFFFLQGLREYLCARRRDCSEPLLSFQIRPLGVIIHIWQSPETADKDASGVISGKEAGLLGLALALDSFGAGVGIALGGFPIWLTVLSVCLISFFAMRGGLKAGSRVGKKSGRCATSLLTGTIFLLLAMTQFL